MGFGVIAVVFIYTTIANMFERPEGLRIAAIFIAGIIIISLLSRIMRSFELHASHVRLDRQALEFLSDVQDGPLAVISHEPLRISREAYMAKLNSADRGQSSALGPGGAFPRSNRGRFIGLRNGA